MLAPVTKASKTPVEPQDAPSPQERFLAAGGNSAERLYAQMTLIRQFEERLLELFDEGELFGTTHCYIGQEANAVGVINHLQAGDIVFSNHRCHGHFLAWSDRPELLMAELMGRQTGVVGGRGGSQHICHHGFYSNGIQGGTVANATGMAMAEKIKQSGKIAVVFMGDGTLGEGIVYESLNMASLWDVPILYVVEHNGWAQSTPSGHELAGDAAMRGSAMGIESNEIHSTDAEELYAHFQSVVQEVRETSRPRFEVIHTYRLCHHSKSDDCRPEAEVDARRKLDPLPLLASRIGSNAAAELEAAAAAKVQQAVDWARDQPMPSGEIPNRDLFGSSTAGTVHAGLSKYGVTARNEV